MICYLLEYWKPVRGFEGLYAVSNVGRVRREVNGHNLKAGATISRRIASAGYWYINLYKNGRVYSRPVHCLVAEAFIGPPPAGMEVNHVDANKQNPFASNLEYTTHRDNILHARRLGLHRSPPYWLTNLRALTDEEVDRLLEMAKTMGNKRLGKVFGLHKKTVARIRKDPESYRRCRVRPR